MKRIGWASALALILVGVAPAQVALSIKVGTLGPGADVTFDVAERVNVRAGGSYFGLNLNDVYDESDVAISWDTDVRLGAVQVLMDWHPTGGGFRLTAGGVYNALRGDATALPIESYTVGSRTFSEEELGSLTATLEHKNTISPYAGLGFGNAVGLGTGLSFAFDLGVTYTNAFSVDIEGTGMIAPTAEQEDALEEDLSGLVLYPVMSLGLSYQF